MQKRWNVVPKREGYIELEIYMAINHDGLLCSNTEASNQECGAHKLSK
jgi:hypothetical protein